ncbi:MAG: heavy metal-binding domain-containing protein [Candidatus Paceibacterota bacterium]
MNNTYICPMHPEITSDKPGDCPKCGMVLVLKSGNSKPKQAVEDRGLGKITLKNYLPLFVVVGVILLVTITLSVRDFGLGFLSISKTLSYFMAGFFLVFSMFKLMDLKGFAEGYSTYDLLAKRVPIYGYFYPFIELFFGLSMILIPMSKNVLMAEVIIMIFSGIGVAIKVAKREPFLCACLGTFLKVPLTTITLVEDFGMAGLGILMLFIN